MYLDLIRVPGRKLLITANVMWVGVKCLPRFTELIGNYLFYGELVCKKFTLRVRYFVGQHVSYLSVWFMVAPLWIYSGCLDINCSIYAVSILSTGSLCESSWPLLNRNMLHYLNLCHIECFPTQYLRRVYYEFFLSRFDLGQHTRIISSFQQKCLPLF